MTAGDRHELVMLLEKYMSEVLQANARNYAKEKAWEAARKKGLKIEYPEYETGVKTKFEHARIILCDLLRQQTGDIKVYY